MKDPTALFYILILGFGSVVWLIGLVLVACSVDWAEWDIVSAIWGLKYAGMTRVPYKITAWLLLIVAAAAFGGTFLSLH